MTATVVSSACLNFSEQGKIVSVGLDSGGLVAVETVWDTVVQAVPIVKFVLLWRAWAGQNIMLMQLTVMQLRATATDGTIPTDPPSPPPFHLVVVVETEGGKLFRYAFG